MLLPFGFAILLYIAGIVLSLLGFINEDVNLTYIGGGILLFVLLMENTVLMVKGDITNNGGATLYQSSILGSHIRSIYIVLMLVGAYTSLNYLWLAGLILASAMGLQVLGGLLAYSYYELTESAVSQGKMSVFSALVH